ncbi:MAG: cation transporter [Chromatiales bacterium]|jgi:cation diffusion facilitator family transporter|nr:cation transporter [Chromatiales bacterium]
MGDCACHDTAAETADQRRAIAIALALNLAMFVIGTVAGLLAESASLLADALDMLADASAYGIALLAIGRTATFKQRAATASGLILAALGSGVVLETIHRAVAGSEPEGWIIVGGAMLSLVINASVLRLLHRYRNGEAHLRASWIFTRADVVANVGVIAAGMLVLVTGSRVPDLVVGCLIGAYVIKEAFEILRDARRA